MTKEHRPPDGSPPAMDARDWERLERAFTEASRLEGEARREYLGAVDRDEPRIAAELRALLDSEEHADALFSAPLGARAIRASPDVPDAIEALVGARIGEYDVVRRIASGGMGTVYEARQEQPERSVALKVLRPDSASSASMARFELEGRILARLQHPGIAHVYATGVDASGGTRVPWVAMELVDGDDIIAATNGARFTRTECIELFAKVCDAVQHAHSRGVIHRDLKPGNILVDEAGQPKVLDFGIACIVAEGVRQTIATGAGEVLGTLQYMSPEQTSGDPEGVDTRSDVYSLGVILHELAVGRAPYDVRSKPLLEAARIICEVEPESTPASRRLLRGDLRTIVLRALEKDRERRYGTVAELAEDLRRHLRHQPIRARPPSALYLLRRFARRRRALVAGLLAFTVALGAGAVATTAAYLRAEREAVEAQKQASRAEQIGHFLETMLVTSSTGAKVSDDTVEARLDEASARLETTFEDEPAIRERLHFLLARAYDGIDRDEKAARELRLSIDRRREAIGADDLSIAERLNSLGVEYLDVGRPRLAVAALEEALDVYGALDATESRAHLMTLENRVVARTAVGDEDGIRSSFRAAVAAIESRGGFAQSDHRRFVSERLEGLLRRGQPQLVLELATPLVPVFRAATGSGGHSLGTLLHYLGKAARTTGDFDLAAEHDRAALDVRREEHGDLHLDVLLSVERVADDLHRAGRLEDALPYCERVAELEDRFPAARASGVDGRRRLGVVLRALGEDAAGLEHIERAVRREAARGDPDGLVRYADGLAIELGLAGDYEAAERTLDVALEELALEPPAGRESWTLEDRLASALYARGALDEATERLEAALRRLPRDADSSRGRVELSRAKRLLAWVALERGDADRAEPLLEEARALLRSVVLEDHVERRLARLGVAAVHLARGRLDLAAPLLESSRALIDAPPRTWDCLTANLFAIYGEADLLVGHPTRAVERLGRAAAILARNRPPDDPQLARVESLLDRASDARRRGDRSPPEDSAAPR